MKPLRFAAAFVAAAAVGALLGDSLRAPAVSAASVNVVMRCNTMSLNSAGTIYTFSCQNSPNDVSGLTVSMFVSAPTARYALGVDATVPLP